jgi:hypothetical protein
MRVIAELTTSEHETNNHYQERFKVNKDELRRTERTTFQNTM